MMMDILENQQVHRRPKSSFYGSAPYGRMYAYGSDFIGQIRQKPARVKRRPPPALRPAPEKKADNGHVHRTVYPVPKKSGGLSAISHSLIMSVFIVVFALFAMGALNWQGLGQSALDSVKLYPDSLIERDLAGFAGIPSLDVPVEDRDIPLDLAEIFEWKKPYTVKWGDSVSSIALAYGLSMDAIITSNNIKDARRLPAGMELRIPNMDGISYTVKKGDNLSTIAESKKVPLNVVLDANNITSSAISPGQILFIPGARMQKEELRRAMGELFIYPIKGRRTDSYGYRINPFTNTQQFHAAIDLAAPTGTPVRASREGRVTSIGNNAVYGKFIILSHAGGYETLYAHLNTIVVKQGSRVNQGEKIGEVGSTGRSTGPHLHFAIYKNDRPVNPLDLL